MRSELHGLPWFDWPEEALYGSSTDWKVFPLAYTFPADGSVPTRWLDKPCAAMPKTAALLRGIPGIRTALISRLGPGSELEPHQGWAALANHVIRCHFVLDCPSGWASEEAAACPVLHAGALNVQATQTLQCPATSPTPCGLVVEDRAWFMATGDSFGFDDSLRHYAYNRSSAVRYVLIVDVARPAHLPAGVATGDETVELREFMKDFERIADGALQHVSGKSSGSSGDSSC